MKTIIMDSANKYLVVALYEDEKCLASLQEEGNRKQSEYAIVYLQKLLQENQLKISDFDEMVITIGPGSYTGLRIGIAGAKAMCFALGIGCNGVSTLESLANNVVDCNLGVCSIIKARQDLVYCAVFKANGGTLTRLTPDAILSTNVLNDTLLSLDGNFVLVGDGAKEFYTNYSNSKYLLSSPHSRLQSASSLCEVASKLPAITPQELQATYLQPTKAEKDLLNR